MAATSPIRSYSVAAMLAPRPVLTKRNHFRGYTWQIWLLWTLKEHGVINLNHAAYTDLDKSTSFSGVYDGHEGDIGTSLQQAFLRVDEMMRGQRGWRELSILGDKINKFSGMIEGLIWSPRSSKGINRVDDWAFEEGPHSDFAGPTSGSTACVAVIRNNQVVVSNAGDSRCVISRKGQM
ncbi:probable protein phosphatase 2C 60 [Medicago truncatula]|nr:probable protein phosphatase 2C 60 [Medicago truncatula]